MTTGQLIILDHIVVLLSVAAWLGAGTAAAKRTVLALGLLAAAVIATFCRVATTAVLAERGWWFVQEKVLLGLPTLVVSGAVALVIAGPRLLAARQAAPVRRSVSATAVVSLFAAGYAALAGLAVTFVAGYPLTWSTALIATSLVCFAVLLTARVVATPGDDVVARTRPGGRGISRRRFMGLAGGAIATSSAATGVGLLFVPAQSVATGGGSGRSLGAGRTVSVADMRGPGMPASGGVKQKFELTAHKARVQLGSGREVDAWTYNGQVPGPPIRVGEGDLVEVTLGNADIDDGVTLHWHGYDVPCGEDGAPGLTQEVVAPGGKFTYRFRATQVGTYWYHTHQASHRGVRRGLYGTLVVTPSERQGGAPDEQLDLTLPIHTFQGAVAIADQDVFSEHVAPPGTPVRLRLINTDPETHRLALVGSPFRVAAVDGRDLNEPGQIDATALRLPAGARRDLTFTMPDELVTVVVDNDRQACVRLRPEAGARQETATDDSSGWSELDLLRYGAPAATPFDATSRFDRHFRLVLDRGVAIVDGSPAYAQTVNGRGHPSIPDQLVAEGDLVKFTVVNRSLEIHPWHLHGHPVLILSKDGTPSSGSPLWVDTFDVRPGEVWEVAFQASNPGIWMNHCHNLPHAHQGMMLRVAYDGVTTPFHGSPTSGNGGTHDDH